MSIYFCIKYLPDEKKKNNKLPVDHMHFDALNHCQRNYLQILPLAGPTSLRQIS